MCIKGHLRGIPSSRSDRRWTRAFATSDHEEKFAYLDGFLPWGELASLAELARALYRDGHMSKGSKVAANTSKNPNYTLYYTICVQIHSFRFRTDP